MKSFIAKTDKKEEILISINQANEERVFININQIVGKIGYDYPPILKELKNSVVNMNFKEIVEFAKYTITKKFNWDKFNYESFCDWVENELESGEF